MKYFIILYILNRKIYIRYYRLKIIILFLWSKYEETIDSRLLHCAAIKMDIWVHQFL